MVTNKYEVIVSSVLPCRGRYHEPIRTSVREFGGNQKRLAIRWAKTGLAEAMAEADWGRAEVNLVTIDADGNCVGVEGVWEKTFVGEEDEEYGW